MKDFAAVSVSTLPAYVVEFLDLESVFTHRSVMLLLQFAAEWITVSVSAKNQDARKIKVILLTVLLRCLVNRLLQFVNKQLGRA